MPHTWQPKGSKHPRAKLDDAAVERLLRDERNAPQMAKALARDGIEVHPATIRAIRRGDAWPHIERPRDMPEWPRGRPGHS